MTSFVKSSTPTFKTHKTRQHCCAGAKYPLLASKHTICDLDLAHSGWTKQLIAAGFDPSLPSVWVAEGLVMYLSDEAVTTLLRELHSVSAPGSRLLVMVRAPAAAKLPVSLVRM